MAKEIMFGEEARRALERGCKPISRYGKSYFRS